MVSYDIYTDGSYKSSLKQGGIGIVWVRNGEKVSEYSKKFSETTNNIMELTAIYYALKSIKKQIDSLKIISDSEYALGCIFNDSWHPKKNVELIAKIKLQLKETQKLVNSKIECEHIKGHQNTSNYNDRADYLASL